jgi:hypothetical protein
MLHAVINERCLETTSVHNFVCQLVIEKMLEAGLLMWALTSHANVDS